MSGPVWVKGGRGRRGAHDMENLPHFPYQGLYMGGGGKQRGGPMGARGDPEEYWFSVYLKPDLLLLHIDFGSSDTFRAQHIKQNPS